MPKLRKRLLKTLVSIRRLNFVLVGIVLALLLHLLSLLALPAGVAQPIAPSNPIPPLQPQCPPPGRSAPASEMTQLVSNATQTATWMDQPGIGVGTLVSQVAPQLMAYLNPAPFPELNSRARQAKVPVMMYHDIRADKQVFFDVTPEEFEAHLQLMQQKGITPISMDQLVNHLRTGAPLPEKPIVLTFDDGYVGHYTYVYPLLKNIAIPACFRSTPTRSLRSWVDRA